MNLFPGTPIHLVLALTGFSLLTVVVWRPVKRPALWALAVLVCATFLLGALTYPAYRSELKPGLLLNHPLLASLFETKEHLAAMTLCSVLGGVGVQVTAGELDAGKQTAQAFFRLAWGLYGVVIVLGIWVTWA